MQTQALDAREKGKKGWFWWFLRHGKSPALLREASLVSGNALHFCGNIPLTAETPCTFAGTIRWLRKRPALLQEHSAGSGNALHFCGSIPLSAESHALLQEGLKWSVLIQNEVFGGFLSKVVVG